MQRYSSRLCASGTGTRARREELLELVRHALHLFCVGRWLALLADIGPGLGVFGVHGKPLFQAGFGIGLDGFRRAFRLADPAIDSFVGVDYQHVFALVEAVHRADLDAVHELALDAGFGDDIGHG